MLPQKIIRLSSNFAPLRVARGLIFCYAFPFTNGMPFFFRNVMINRVMLGKVSGLEREHGQSRRVCPWALKVEGFSLYKKTYLYGSLCFMVTLP
jgi:hypothetical protein